MQVSAGTTATVSLTYDAASSFTLKYAANSSNTVSIPTNLEATFTGGLADIVKTTPGSPYKLYPMPAGYQAVAGIVHDLQERRPRRTGPRRRPPTPASALPQWRPRPAGNGLLPIPMGVVQVQIPNDDDKRYVTARQVTTAGSGNPGCATVKDYTFARFPKNSTQYIALPYGTWNL